MSWNRKGVLCASTKPIPDQLCQGTIDKDKALMRLKVLEPCIYQRAGRAGSRRYN